MRPGLAGIGSCVSTIIWWIKSLSCARSSALNRTTYFLTAISFAATNHLQRFLGRSLQDLIAFLNEIHAAGVDLYLHQQGLDTSTPAGKAMFQMLGVFAEFVRALIRERVMAGLKRAKAQGKVLGRPKVDERIEAAIRRSLLKGNGTKKTAQRAGVGIGTVLRVKAELASTAE
jgi:DNA invertase Pin-like site-specific DNA recombinase